MIMGGPKENEQKLIKLLPFFPFLDHPLLKLNVSGHVDMNVSKVNLFDKSDPNENSLPPSISDMMPSLWFEVAMIPFLSLVK